jgi:hypothetical protein
MEAAAADLPELSTHAHSVPVVIRCSVLGAVLHSVGAVFLICVSVAAD